MTDREAMRAAIEGLRKVPQNASEAANRYVIVHNSVIDAVLALPPLAEPRTAGEVEPSNAAGSPAHIPTTPLTLQLSAAAQLSDKQPPENWRELLTAAVGRLRAYEIYTFLVRTGRADIAGKPPGGDQ